MSDLAAFLRARLDEDEAAAQAMAEPGGSHWPWLETRLLREVAAKRAILDGIQGAVSIVAVAGTVHVDNWVQRALAAVYSDHPDYRQEWEREAVR